MSPPLLVTPPSLELIDAAPGFFSKIFQNLRLSSAAAQGVSSGTTLEEEMTKLTCRGEHLTVRAEAAVENSRLVRRDLDIAYQGWVAPDAQRVIWEAAGADNLFVVVAPAEACHLGPSVDAVSASSGGGVPEMDVSIVGPSACGQQVWLPRAPA